jgi:hypothetical protein
MSVNAAHRQGVSVKPTAFTDILVSKSTRRGSFPSKLSGFTDRNVSMLASLLSPFTDKNVSKIDPWPWIMTMVAVVVVFKELT